MSGRVRRRWLPKSIRGRIFFGLGCVALLLLFGVVLIVSSVWVENQFSAGHSKDARLPAVRRLVTKPVVNALGRQAEAYLRRRSEARYLNTGLSIDETIRRFLDDRIDFSERRNFAYRLAHEGSPECIKALLRVLETAPPEQKAFIAQLIGSTGNPAAKSALWSLLEDPNERVVMATIQGLSALGGDDVTSRVAGILSDAGRSEHIRVSAALGLGTIGTPEARRFLIESLRHDLPNELATQILNGLGRFQFTTIADTFRQFIADPETPSEMRVAALEALAVSSSDAVPFLLGFAGSDVDEDARAAAAWAISAQVNVRDLGPKLGEMVNAEAVPEVRQRLYEALLPQDVIPADRLLPIIVAEQDIAARVAGFNAIGRAVAQQPRSAVALEFDQRIVPELARIATQPNSLNIQMRAVFALRRAGTASANAALTTLAYTARRQIAAAARHGIGR